MRWSIECPIYVPSPHHAHTAHHIHIYTQKHTLTHTRRRDTVHITISNRWMYQQSAPNSTNRRAPTEQYSKSKTWYLFHLNRQFNLDRPPRNTSSRAQLSLAKNAAIYFFLTSRLGALLNTPRTLHTLPSRCYPRQISRPLRLTVQLCCASPSRRTYTSRKHRLYRWSEEEVCIVHESNQCPDTSKTSVALSELNHRYSDPFFHHTTCFGILLHKKRFFLPRAKQKKQHKNKITHPHS